MQKQLLATVLSAALLWSCGTQNPAEYVADTSQAVDMQPAIPDKQEEQNGGQPLGKGKEEQVTERKLIKEGTLEYSTAKLEAAKALWLNAAKHWKGYVASETAYKTDDRLSITLTLRVPFAAFDSVLIAGSSGVDYFDRKEIQTKDVTEEFVDTEARVKTKKELEQRYIGLLQKANAVSEMLEIERELGNLRSDIEAIEGRLNVLKNQVAFSTLQVTIYKQDSAPAFLGSRLVQSLSTGWSNLLDFVVGITSLWPFIFLGAGVFIAIKRWRRLRTKK